MKNITNAYLVLSVADIRAMLHAAELEQKVRNDYREAMAIVFDGLTTVKYGKDLQIASWSVREVVDNLVNKSIKDLNSRYPIAPLGYASQNPSTGLPATTPMNHSDAAI